MRVNGPARGSSLTIDFQLKSALPKSWLSGKDDDAWHASRRLSLRHVLGLSDGHGRVGGDGFRRRLRGRLELRSRRLVEIVGTKARRAAPRRIRVGRGVDPRSWMSLSPFLNSTRLLPSERPTLGRFFPKSSTAMTPTIIISTGPRPNMTQSSLAQRVSQSMPPGVASPADRSDRPA